MMANNTQSDDDWSLYPYDPSKAAPIAFAILLTVVACYQFYQCFVRYHWKKFGGEYDDQREATREKRLTST